MKKKHIIIASCAVAACLICVSVIVLTRPAPPPPPEPTVLADIVYKNKRQKEEEYTIYIPEEGEYEPYLVIDGDYDGGVLLRRKYLTPDEGVAWISDKNPPYPPSPEGNPERAYLGQYYPASCLDGYLRIEFLERFPTSLQTMMLETNIIVASHGAIRYRQGRRDTETIRRKAFLLSLDEMGLHWGDSTAAVEGETLLYYGHRNKNIETYKDGQAGVYWLRSTFFGQGGGELAHMVSWEGYSGGGAQVSRTFPILPAFCLPPDTPIERIEIEGKEVFVLSGV